LNLNLECQKL